MWKDDKPPFVILPLTVLLSFVFNIGKKYSKKRNQGNICFPNYSLHLSLKQIFAITDFVATGTTNIRVFESVGRFEALILYEG